LNEKIKKAENKKLWSDQQGKNKNYKREGSGIKIKWSDLFEKLQSE